MKASLDRRKRVKGRNVSCVRKDIIEGSWGHYRCVFLMRQKMLVEEEDAWFNEHSIALLVWVYFRLG
jgi:hypothetical protein